MNSNARFRATGTLRTHDPPSGGPAQKNNKLFGWDKE